MSSRGGLKPPAFGSWISWSRIIRSKGPAEEYEVAAAAVFLGSDEASSITGQTLVVKYGQHIIF
jgi:enoyl-[acyl-carrier-protein] reductase (NADH)